MTMGCSSAKHALDQARDASLGYKPEAAPAILVVDDQIERAKVTVSALAEAGYRTRRVPDAKSALAAVDHARPHLVILDVLLPPADGIDGSTLATRLLVLGVPTIVLCSLRVTALRPDLAFVRRGCDRSELLEAVARLLWGTIK